MMPDGCVPSSCREGAHVPKLAFTGLRRYTYAGLGLESSLVFPELVQMPAGHSLAADIFVGVDAPVVQRDTDHPWNQRWEVEGKPWLMLARCADGRVLRFPGSADIAMRDDGAIRIAAVAGAGMDTIRHHVLDQALPRFIAQSGKLVLHASAVCMADGRAVLFLGNSGDGKSTLAAGFAARCGGQVLADDCVVLEPALDGVRAIPSYPGLRLWHDSLTNLYPQRAATAARVAAYSSKRRLEFPPINTESQSVSIDPAPIAAIFALEVWSDTKEIWLGSLSAKQACQTLMRNAFVLDSDDRRNSLALIAQAIETVRQTTVFALDYPRRYDWLDRAADAILARVAVAEPAVNDGTAPRISSN